MPVQTRASSFGLRNIRFATRSGVRVLLDQAAGIVIDLLVAPSVIALVKAGVMLAACARAAAGSAPAAPGRSAPGSWPHAGRGRCRPSSRSGFRPLSCC